MSTFGRCGTPALEMERAIDTPIPQLFADHIAPPASCAYRSYEGQGSHGGVDTVHRDIMGAGIRHIGELSRRSDNDRGRTQFRSYCSPVELIVERSEIFDQIKAEFRFEHEGAVTRATQVPRFLQDPTSR
jgi:hypothetical protein